jgi:protein phosphatase PTC1
MDALLDDEHERRQQEQVRPTNTTSSPSSPTQSSAPTNVEVDYTKVPPKPLKSIKDIGFCEEMNGRYRRTMEDGHCMIDGFKGDDNSGYFAIYDGHGGKNAVLQVQKVFHTVS